jgi:hypothetical protein
MLAIYPYRQVPFTLGDKMKLNVYWSEITHYNAEIVVDDGMSEDEIHERLHTIISRDIIGEEIGGEIEHDSIDWDEIN